MADKYKTFPETESYCAEPPSEEGGPNYVPSSESVGAGHEQSMNRMPKFSNGEFPNEESGEGKG